MHITVGGEGGLTLEFIYKDEIDSCARPLVEHAKQRRAFKGDISEIYYLPILGEDGKVLIGLGEKENLTLDKVRKIFFELAKLMLNNEESKVTVDSARFDQFEARLLAEAIAEGLLQATYRFNRYKTDAKPCVDISVYYRTLPEDEEEAKKGINDAAALIDGIFLARNLVNEPANVMTPANLARKAEMHLTPLNIDVQIYNRKQIEEIGMKAFLSVAKGSANEPQLIVMTYNGGEPDGERLALVGKGLTYDSGGYSIKPTSSMVTMNSDMSGAATVIGTMQTLAKFGVKANVVGVIAACENLISGEAYKPGDIIGSLSGKTIEVVNTDAEGRLTLADAVYYATSKEGLNCDRVIDIATLTGACTVALGEEYTGVVTNDKAFLKSLLDAARLCGERVWELPADEDFGKRNESKRADLKNSGGRLGGAISAALFVGEFVANKKPWIHLDIAGTAYLEKAQGYLPEGATGVHVKTLTMMVAEDQSLA